MFEQLTDKKIGVNILRKSFIIYTMEKYGNEMTY